MHLRPEGENVHAVKRFLKAGGTHLILAHMPYGDIPIIGEKSYEKAFQRTIRMAERVRKETKAKVFVTVGPYPADLVGMIERMPIESARETMMRGMELAALFVENNLAIAIGEIGRPHFPVSKEIMLTSNEILKYGLELGREVDCAVVLHTESATLETFKELAEMADSVGFPRARIVKHFSPPIVEQERNHGLIPSVLANRENIKSALEQGNRFLMETDYIDDPRRPGAVLGPATVPKTTRRLMDEGLLTMEDALAIHKTNPERVYRISIE